jgi:hypothetical protein
VTDELIEIIVVNLHHLLRERKEDERDGREAE